METCSSLSCRSNLICSRWPNPSNLASTRGSSTSGLSIAGACPTGANLHWLRLQPLVLSWNLQRRCCFRARTTVTLTSATRLARGRLIHLPLSSTQERGAPFPLRLILLLRLLRFNAAPASSAAVGAATTTTAATTVRPVAARTLSLPPLPQALPGTDL